MNGAARKTALFAVATSIALNIAMWCFSSDSLPLILKRTLWDKNLAQVYFVTGMDDFLDADVRGENIALRFQGFPAPIKPGEIDVPILMYERVVFHQYPNAVYAAPPGKVVNVGNDLMEQPFEPTRKSMGQRGVTAFVTFQRYPSGAIRQRIERIPKIEPAKINDTETTGNGE